MAAPAAPHSTPPSHRCLLTHLDAPDHQKLALAIADKIRSIAN